MRSPPPTSSFTAATVRSGSRWRHGPPASAPIHYRPEAVERDIANLKAALEGMDVVDAFMPAVAPASLEVDFGNEHYAAQEDLLYALADALHEEYRAIVEAGFQLQVDDAWIPAFWDREPTLNRDEYRHFAATRVEALNHALEGLPEDRVRYHLCWGSWHGPHAHDVPLADIVDLMLQVDASTYLDRGGERQARARVPPLGDGRPARGEGARTRRRHALDEPRRASGARRRAHRPLRRACRPGQRDREHGLRHGLPYPSPARLGEARGARRRCAPGERTPFWG